MKYILILEDDADLAAGMEMALMSDDFSFTICSTIKEAEEKFRQQTFDLLILDVNLPDGSGFELCRKIRKSSKVSIILLTARDMELEMDLSVWRRVPSKSRMINLYIVFALYIDICCYTEKSISNAGFRICSCFSVIYCLLKILFHNASRCKFKIETLLHSQNLHFQCLLPRTLIYLWM